MAEGAVVIASTRWDPSDRMVQTSAPDESIAAIIARVLPDADARQLDRAEVWIFRGDGTGEAVQVPRHWWHRVYPHEGTIVDIRIPPGGGDVLRTVLLLAVIVVAAIAAPYLAPAFLTAAVGAGAATAIVQAGLVIAGTMLVNALVPARAPTLGSGRQASQTYSIAGTQNPFSPWGVVPALLGRHRVPLPRVTYPMTEAAGDDQYVRELYGMIGPVEWEPDQWKIGSTLLSDFSDVEFQVVENHLIGGIPSLFPGAVIEDASDPVEITHDAGPVIRTSATDAIELSVDIAFPRGLFHFSDGGNREALSVDVKIEYRKVGGASWIDVETLTVQDAKGEAFRVSKRWIAVDGPATYDVRISRVSADRTSTRDYDLISWSALRAFRPYASVLADYPMTLVALRIKATGQLNGQVDGFSGVGTSIAPDWDAATSTWITRPTRWPAAHLRRVAMSHENGNPLASDEIDEASLIEFDAWCRANGFTYDRVHDFDSSVEDVFGDIAAAGRATFRPWNGRRQIVIDRPQDLAFGHIGTRNSRDFAGTVLFPDIPDAFLVRFVDENQDWKQTERLVTRPDLLGPAQKFERLEFPGECQADRIWKSARRRFREIAARSEEFSRVLDWEELRYRPGQLVYASHWLLDRDHTSGRIKSVSGPAIHLDEPVTMVAGQNYGLRWRRSNWESATRQIVTRPGRSTLVFLVDAEAPPAAGDLFMFGRAEQEALELIVKSVVAGDGDSARLTLVAHAPEISEDDSAAPPPFIPDAVAPSPIADLPPSLPVILGIASGTPVMQSLDDGSVQLPVVVTISAGSGTGAPADIYEVEWRRDSVPPLGLGTDQVLAATGKARRIGFPAGTALSVRARARSLYGKYSAWTDWRSHIVQARDDLPPDVASFSVISLPSSGTRRFTWSLAAPAPSDLLGFQVRSRPGAGWSWDDLVPVHSAVLLASPWEAGVPPTAGAHTIGIVAVDTTRQVSANPRLVEVDLGPAYAGMILQRVEAGLGWPGTIAGASVTAGGLVATAPGLPSALIYTLPLIDLGADMDVTVSVTPYGAAGTVSIEMSTALAAAFPTMGAASPLGAVSARYLSISITINNSSGAATLSDAVTIVEAS